LNQTLAFSGGFYFCEGVVLLETQIQAGGKMKRLKEGFKVQLANIVGCLVGISERQSF